MNLEMKVKEKHDSRNRRVKQREEVFQQRISKMKDALFELQTHETETQLKHN